MERNKAKLNSVLSKYDEHERQMDELATQERRAENKFLDNFSKLINETIYPIMDEIGREIKSKGHDYEIIPELKRKNDVDSVLDSRITMRIYRRGEKRSMEPPHISFMTEMRTHLVYCWENNRINGSGTNGSKEERYIVEDITKNIVEEEIIDSLAKILRTEG
jgi:hypothetical protein